jgi:RNA polymerase sigma-70 factor (ECF subfamily)
MAIPRGKPRLTLVPSAGPAEPQGRAGQRREWSGLMARAQDGDRDAYRALLEDIAPYLRALAARCFREPSDIEDAVQDILLTVHAVRHGSSPSPTGASSTGCGGRCARAPAKSN